MSTAEREPLRAALEDGLTKALRLMRHDITSGGLYLSPANRERLIADLDAVEAAIEAAMNTPEPTAPLTAEGRLTDSEVALIYEAFMGVNATEALTVEGKRRIVEPLYSAFIGIRNARLLALVAAAHPPATVPAPTHYSGPHDDCIATIAHWHDRPYRVGEWAATFDEGWIAPPATVPDEGLVAVAAELEWVAERRRVNDIIAASLLVDARYLRSLSKPETGQELRESPFEKAEFDWPSRPDLAYAGLRTFIRAALSTTDDKVGES